MIEIVNNFLPSKLERYLEDIFLDKSYTKMPLFFTRNITTGKGNFLPSFSSEFYPSFSPLSTLLLNVLYYFSYTQSLYIDTLIRAKAITQLPSSNPGLNIIHTDMEEPHWVLLYYVNDSDGDTILFNDKEEEIQRITPQKGKAVFFDGNVKHCSSRPSKFSRSILNFNFIGEKL